MIKRLFLGRANATKAGAANPNAAAEPTSTASSQRTARATATRGLSRTQRFRKRRAERPRGWARAKNILSGFVLPLLLALVLFASLVYFVFPTTTWLDQRAEASEVNEQFEALVAEQVELRKDIGRMRTDDEVERIARRDFNLVFPGEEAYALLPAPPKPVSLPTSWPFSMLHDEVID